MIRYLVALTVVALTLTFPIPKPNSLEEKLVLAPISLPSLPAPPPLKKQTKTVSVTSTAYCLGPCSVCQTTGRTATGTTGPRGVAVSARASKAFPMGATVSVKGYGRAKVDDVGGGVRSNQIDLRFKSHKDALNWGHQRNTQVILNVE